MHIVIDVRRIYDFGIGTYIRNLIGGLAQLDSAHRYTLVTRPKDAAGLSKMPPNFSAASYPRPDTALIHNITFPRFLRSFKADLYHIPLNSIAWWMPKPYIVTIHDMSSLLFPQHARDFRRTIQEERYRRGAQRADRIITVSNSTRRDIEHVLHVPASRIRTIYSAPDPAFTDGCSD